MMMPVSGSYVASEVKVLLISLCVCSVFMQNNDVVCYTQCLS